MTVNWTGDAISYARFSDRRNAEQCESNEAQLDFIREFCDEKGWRIAESFSDERMSGRGKANATNRDELDRPGLWGAVDAIKRGYTLVAWRPDRIARDVFLDELVRREVEKAGGRVVTVLANTDGDTPESNMMRTILAAFSQYERDVISIRTSAAMHRHQANGRRMTSLAHIPYGWRPCPRDLALMEEHPEEQAIICVVVDMFRSKHAIKDICRYLESSKTPTRSGGSWYPQSVRRILRRAGEYLTPKEREVAV
jgi:DNA invertase Pin-like site-specific DNA recombinase